MKGFHYITILLVVSWLLSPYPLAAQDSDGSVTASPKPGWGEFEVVEQDLSRPWWSQALLWPVNRVLDVIDVFRVDVGVGGARGAVARITKHGNFGYRSVSPGSLRIGGFGRDWPVKIESSSEFGAGPSYVHSADREVCDFELGIGLDLYVGAYAGVCIGEVFDFIGGVFFLDPKDDDIR